MKKALFVTAIILLGPVAPAQAQQNDLSITLDFSYHTKWLSKGVEAYGQKGAFFSTVDLDFYGTGFGLNVTQADTLTAIDLIIVLTTKVYSSPMRPLLQITISVSVTNITTV